MIVHSLALLDLRQMRGSNDQCAVPFKLLKQLIAEKLDKTEIPDGAVLSCGVM